MALVLLFAMPVADAGEPAIPEAAQRQIDAAQAAIDKAKQTYQQAVKRESERLAQALEQAKAAATRSGKFEDAMAVKAAQERLAGGTILQWEVTAALDTLGDGDGLPRSPLVSEAQAKQLALLVPTITAAQWDQLPGQLVTIDARSDLTPVPFPVKAGERYVIVPHPDDRWLNVGGTPTLTARGGGAYGQYPIMALLAQSGTQIVEVMKQPMITIPAGGERIDLYGHDRGHGDNSGSMRVKILKVR